MATPKDVLKMAKDNKAKMVDFKFMDYPGLWQHFSVPVDELTEAIFEEGLGFDGSSIRGWQSIHTSDMLVVPDAETAVMDPFTKYATLSLICNIVDPITKERYSRDPRHIAQKAEAYLKSTGIGDTCYMGPEAEFFIFDDIRFDQTSNSGYYFIDSEEGIWNSGRDEKPNLGYKPRHKEGYFPVPPIDSQEDIRSEMVAEMQKVGIDSRSASTMKWRPPARPRSTCGSTPLRASARTSSCMFKYVIKNVAKRHGKTVTFMPKPLFGDNGSGMHIHQSLWKGGKPLFAGDKYAGLIADGAVVHRRHAEARAGASRPSRTRPRTPTSV